MSRHFVSIRNTGGSLVLARKSSTVGRAPLTHPTAPITWTRTPLDRDHFRDVLGRDLEEVAWQRLELIAGHHLGRAAIPDHGLPLPDVRRHLERIMEATLELGALLNTPAGIAIKLELDILDNFLIERPDEFKSIYRRTPLDIDNNLRMIVERIAILKLSHTATSVEGSFGYAHRTSWNLLVGELSNWCAANGISTRFHARGESSSVPVFRRLLSEIDRLLPTDHRQKFGSVDTEIRAIERALALPTAR